MTSVGAIPKEIADLVDKTLLFKVELKNNFNFRFEQSYRVEKNCIDASIIKEFKDVHMKSLEVNSENAYVADRKGKMIDDCSVLIAQGVLKNKISAGEQCCDRECIEFLQNSTDGEQHLRCGLKELLLLVQGRPQFTSSNES